MLNINLLSKEDQRAARAREACRVVWFFTILVSVVCVVAFALLLPSYFAVHVARDERTRSLYVEQAQVAQQRDLAEAASGARRLRLKISEIRKALGATAGPSAIIRKMLISQSGIAVTSLTVARSGGAAIEGRAATRDDLLRFEESLRASDLFLALSFPLADIVRERDIAYSVHTTLKPPYLW